MLLGIYSILADFSTWLVTWAPIFGAVAAIIAIYKFFIKQPALVLQADVETHSQTRPFTTVHVSPTLWLSNEGRDFAEDVSLQMELPDWGLRRREGSELVSSFLDVTAERDGYFGSPRQLYSVTANEPIQPRDQYRMFFGGADLERGISYEIEYTISCRSHGPRTGSIEFHVNHKDVEIVHNYPKRRRRYLLALREALSWETPNVAEMDCLEHDFEWKSDRIVRFTALVKNQGSRRARLANVDLDLFYGDVDAENYLTSVSNTVIGLDSKEFWRIIIEFQLEERLTKDDVSIDYSISANSNHLAEGWDRVGVVNHDAKLPDDSDSTLRVSGRIENLNAGTERTAHVVVKFYDENGSVLFSDDTRIDLEPGEATDFTLYPTTGEEFKRDVTDYDIVLMG